MANPACTIIHGTGSDYGASYCHVVPYSFWSGVAGSFLVNICTFLLVFYVHNTCHDSRWCLRWGKYPAAGGVFRLCRHHHPDLRGTRPHRELIHRMHREHQERLSGGPGVPQG